MKRRTVAERVNEFMEKHPESAKISIVEMDELQQSGSMFHIIRNAFCLGYMRGIGRRKRYGMSKNKKKLHKMIDCIHDSNVVEYLETFVRLFIEKYDRVPDMGKGGTSND